MGALALLTMNEVAELEGVHRSSILRRVQNDKLQVIQVSTPGGRRGYEYRITLDQLSDKAQRKYYARLKGEVCPASTCAASAPADNAPKKADKEMSLKELTAAQRADIDFWLGIIREYNLFIAGHYKNTTEKTREFARIAKERYPDKSISERTLRRKIKELRDMGEVGLADFRLQNKHKGSSVVDGIVWSAFLQYWLDQARPTASACYRLVDGFLRLEGRKRPELLELLPLPHISTIYSLVRKIPHPVEQYYRYGNKAFEDDCMPYLERDYEGLDVNEVWTADYHTLDFDVRCDVSGDIFRPYVVVWMDIRSRKVVGLAITRSANSDGVIIAFRKAIMKHGIPSIFYGDNGREFLTSDFGGRGRRKTDQSADYGKTILQRLGVAMHNTQVANAKAKAIERFFKEICQNFSKFIPTYVGGSPADRPERHGKLTKDQRPLLSEVSVWLENYIEGVYNNQPSNAKGLKGLSPNQFWQKSWDEGFVHRKVARQEHLDLLMLRSERLQMLKREGVFITIGKRKVWFYNADLLGTYMNHKVYVRYNPEDLSAVHIYDDKERYIGEAALRSTGDYDFGSEKTKEAIKGLNREKKQLKGNVMNYLDDQKSVIKVMEAIDVIQAMAAEQMAGYSEPNNYIRQPMFGQFDRAVGFDEGVKVDITRMAENAAKNTKPKYGRK